MQSYYLQVNAAQLYFLKEKCEKELSQINQQIVELMDEDIEKANKLKESKKDYREMLNNILKEINYHLNS